MRGNWSVDYLKEQAAECQGGAGRQLSPTPCELVAQGRADAIVENIDFFMRHTKNYPDVKWVVLPDPIDVGYCAIGLQQGNYPLRDVLNIILYGLHSSNFVNETLGEVVRRADAGEGRAEPLLLSMR